MCYKGKCVHCLEVESGALIFAIFNIIGVSLGCVAAIGGLIYTNFMTQKVIQKADAEGNKKWIERALVFHHAVDVELAILIVILLISFAFAVVLLVGLWKRNARLVKCYFIFGVVKAALGSRSLLSLGAHAPFTILQMIIIFNLFFALMLVMVHMTYRKFETEVAYNSFTNPKSLIKKF